LVLTVFGWFHGITLQGIGTDHYLIVNKRFCLVRTIPDLSQPFRNFTGYTQSQMAWINSVLSLLGLLSANLLGLLKYSASGYTQVNLSTVYPLNRNGYGDIQDPTVYIQG